MLVDFLHQHIFQAQQLFTWGPVGRWMFTIASRSLKFINYSGHNSLVIFGVESRLAILIVN